MWARAQLLGSPSDRHTDYLPLLNPHSPPHSSGAADGQVPQVALLAQQGRQASLHEVLSVAPQKQRIGRTQKGVGRSTVCMGELRRTREDRGMDRRVIGEPPSLWLGWGATQPTSGIGDSAPAVGNCQLHTAPRVNEERSPISFHGRRNLTVCV